MKNLTAKQEHSSLAKHYINELLTVIKKQKPVKDRRNKKVLKDK